MATIRADCSDAMFSAHCLVHQRFDVAHQQIVDHRLRVRLVEVVPARPGASDLTSRRPAGAVARTAGSCFIVLMKRV